MPNKKISAYQKQKQKIVELEKELRDACRISSLKEALIDKTKHKLFFYRIEPDDLHGGLKLYFLRLNKKTYTRYMALCSKNFLYEVSLETLTKYFISKSSKVKPIAKQMVSESF